MLFRVSKSTETMESYSNTQIMKSMVYMVLTSSVDDILSNRKSSSAYSKQFRPRSYNKEFRNWIESLVRVGNKGDSTIIAENTIHNLIINFIDGKNVDGSENNAINTVLRIIEHYDPSISDKEIGDNYTLKESKYGIIYNIFTKYRLTNSDYIGKEHFEMDRESGGRTTEDGDELELFDSIGVEVDFFENIPELDLKMVCRKIHELFFINNNNEFENIRQLCEAYNTILAIEAINERKNAPYEYRIIPEDYLSQEERQRIEFLIDEDFHNRFLNMNEIERLELLKNNILRFEGEDLDNCLLFFALLIKSDIDLKVRGTQYFKNTSTLAMSTINNVEDFKQVMRSTSNLVQKYSEFPLLRDTSLESLIVDKVKVRDKNIPDKDSYEIQLRNGSKVSETPTIRMSRHLEKYLKDLISYNQSINKIEEDMNLKYNFGFPWYDTIRKEDIDISIKLTENPEDYNIKNYLDLYSAFVNDNVKLDPNQTEWVLKEKYIELLTGRAGNTAAYSRLNNMWELINGAREKLILLESKMEVVNHNLIETVSLIDYILIDRFKIFKCKVNYKKEVTVTLGGQFEVKFHPPEYRHGEFIFQDNKYYISVDTEMAKGVKYDTLNYLEAQQKITRELAKIENSNPNLATMDFNDWLDAPLKLSSASKSQAEVKRRNITKNIKEESIMDINDFLEEF